MTHNCYVAVWPHITDKRTTMSQMGQLCQNGANRYACVQYTHTHILHSTYKRLYAKGWIWKFNTISVDSVQFISVPQSCPTLCDPMDCSTSGFPVHHQPQELAQTLVYWVSDAIQLSSPLSSPSPPTFYLSQLQGLFQWVGSSQQVAKVLELQFSISPSMNIQGWFPLELTGLIS